MFNTSINDKKYSTLQTRFAVQGSVIVGRISTVEVPTSVSFHYLSADLWKGSTHIPKILQETQVEFK